MLRIKAKEHDKKKTLLHVLCKGIKGTHTCKTDPTFKDHAFARLWVHVYSLKEVNVVVAKLVDNTQNSLQIGPDGKPSSSELPNKDKPDKTSTLRYPDEDYSTKGLNKDANHRLRSGVVLYNIENFNNSNDPVDVPYADKDGYLPFDMANNGGTALQTINKAIPKTTGIRRVVIAKKMISFYKLARDTNIGDKELAVSSNGPVFSSDHYTLGTERVQTAKIGPPIGGVVVVELKKNLTMKHKAGDYLVFPAVGWSSDPILVVEDNSPPEVVKQTILHEVGHADLGLLDVTDSKDSSKATSIMHWQVDGECKCLRYLPRPWTYDPGEENQWETIPRPPTP